MANKKAIQLLEAMRSSQDNWSRHDLESLYIGFNFRIRRGKKHDIAIHNKYSKLRGTLPNHKSFAKGYISSAIKLIDYLQKLVDLGEKDE